MRHRRNDDRLCLLRESDDRDTGAALVHAVKSLAAENDAQGDARRRISASPFQAEAVTLSQQDGRERPGGSLVSVGQSSRHPACSQRNASRSAIPGKADHAVGRGFDTPIDRAARLETEDSRRLILVLADQQLDRIQDPGNFADTADHLGAWKQFGDQRQPCAPFWTVSDLRGRQANRCKGRDDGLEQSPALARR